MGGGAVGEHLDPVDGREGDGVQVDGRVGARAAGDHAAPVQEDQGPLRSEAAEVDLERAVAAVVDLVVDAVLLLREGLEEGADAVLAAVDELLAVDHQDGGRRGEVEAPHAATRHHHLFHLHGLRDHREVRPQRGVGLDREVGALGRLVAAELRREPVAAGRQAGDGERAVRAGHGRLLALEGGAGGDDDRADDGLARGAVGHDAGDHAGGLCGRDPGAEQQRDRNEPQEVQQVLPHGDVLPGEMRRSRNRMECYRAAE